MSTPDAEALKTAIEWAEQRVDYFRLTNGTMMQEGCHIQTLLAAARQSRTAPNADCVKAAELLRAEADTILTQSLYDEYIALASRLLAMGAAPEHEKLIAEIDEWLSDSEEPMGDDFRIASSLLTRCRTALAPNCGPQDVSHTPSGTGRADANVKAPAGSIPAPAAPHTELIADLLAAWKREDVPLDMLDLMQRARYALASTVPVEQRIPREPTEAMQQAGIAAMFDTESSDLKTREWYKIVRKGWRAMYDAASPQDTQQEQHHGD